jgi:hypothetical protein
MSIRVRLGAGSGIELLMSAVSVEADQSCNACSMRSTLAVSWPS